MLEYLDGFEDSAKPLTKDVSDTHKEYLSELNFEDCNWSCLNDVQQLATLSAIDGRMDEIGVPVNLRSELAHDTLSEDIADAYDNFIVENYGSNGCEVNEFEKQHIEAPQDCIQIEQKTMTELNSIANKLMNQGYDSSVAALVASELVKVDSRIKHLVERWLKGEEADAESHGYSILGLMKSRNMTYPAAFLTID